MAQTTVSATVARPVRGGAQTGVGFALVSLVAAFHHFTPEQFGALVGVAAIVVSFVHNLLEDRGIIPALLKAEPPADDPVPVVDTTVSDSAAAAVTKAKKATTRKRAG